MPLPTLFAFAFFFLLLGLCIGSFLNVVIWRLPHRGHEVMYLEKKGQLTLSWPPSHCPVCDAPIRFYQNIPILSYLALRGRCAKCKTPIPIRYPLVELATGCLWLGLFLAYFAGDWQARVYPWQTGIGIPDLAAIQNGQGLWSYFPQLAPFLLHGLFASALLAASAIDADFFIIPLEIPYMLAIVGVLACAFIGQPFMHNNFAIIPTIENHWILAKPIAGAFLGLILANVLMACKIMPRSFADMDRETLPAEPKHEHKAQSGFAATGPKESDKSKKQKTKNLAPQPEPAEQPLAPPPKLTRFGPSVITTIILLALAAAVWFATTPKIASVVTLVAGILIFLIGVLPRDAGQIDLTDDVMEEISHPHVRREVSKELLFVAIPILCAIIAHLLPFSFPQFPWLGRILGSLMGFLVGGGIVWIIRIAGSLAFNKEAMGMGDAHLMAGVGAIIGAPLVVLAFFAAPLLGILWAIVLKILGKPNVLPYGPWLSVASLLILLLGNPFICFYLRLMGMPC